VQAKDESPTPQRWRGAVATSRRLAEDALALIALDLEELPR